MNSENSEYKYLHSPPSTSSTKQVIPTLTIHHFYMSFEITRKEEDTKKKYLCVFVSLKFMKTFPPYINEIFIKKLQKIYIMGLRPDLFVPIRIL